MASEPKGYIRVPVWVDDGVVKSLVNDDGRVPVVLELSDITVDVNLKTSDITLGVTESSPLTSLQSQLYGWDLDTWRKNPLVWGYTDRWVDAVEYTMLADANYTRVVVTPSAGYIYVVQAASVQNRTAARGRALIRVRVGGKDYPIACTLTPAQYEVTVFRGPLVLKAGDDFRFTQVSCLTDDVIHTIAWGYKIKINE